ATFAYRELSLIMKSYSKLFLTTLKFFLNSRSTPRWIIFFIDIAICIISLIFAYIVRFNFSIPKNEISTWYFVFPYVIVISDVSFLVFRMYAGIIRYSSTSDAFRILTTLFTGSVFIGLSNLLSYQYTSRFIVPYS